MFVWLSLLVPSRASSNVSVGYVWENALIVSLVAVTRPPSFHERPGELLSFVRRLLLVPLVAKPVYVFPYGLLDFSPGVPSRPLVFVFVDVPRQRLRPKA